MAKTNISAKNNDLITEFYTFGLKMILPETSHYHDLGPTTNRYEKLKSILIEIWELKDNSYADSKIIDSQIKSLYSEAHFLKISKGGFHLGVRGHPAPGHRSSFVFYNNLKHKSLTENQALNVWNQAHEEAHAAIFLGAKRDLETLVGCEILNCESEEEFCDKAAIYALKKWGCELPEDAMIPYEERKRRIYSLIITKSQQGPYQSYY